MDFQKTARKVLRGIGLCLALTLAAFAVSQQSSQKSNAQNNTSAARRSTAQRSTSDSKSSSTSSKKKVTATKGTRKKKKVIKKRPYRRARSYVPPVRVSASVRQTSLKFVQQQVAEPSADWIEQPEELDRFFAQLARLERDPKSTPVHVLHFGDSHTAADEFTGQMRTLLQERYGNGGAGYSFAGYPFAGCRIHGTKREQSSGWRTIGNHFREPNDGMLGLGGLVIESSNAGERVTFDGAFSHGEVQFLQQPEGGDFSVYNDGAVVSTVSTSGQLGPGLFVVDAPEGEHHLEIVTTSSAAVRLVGIVSDNQAGVTHEAIGINGAEAALILKWNEDLQRAYLQRRAPALIVLDYGTNEASNKNWTYEAYNAMFRSLIGRFRRSAPDASILVLGPPDRYIYAKVGKKRVWKPFEGTATIIKAQRDVCAALGCAFWDKRERMGGFGSMRQWAYAQWAQADHTHFTAGGYHELANALFSDIMQRYDIYKKEHVVNGSTPNGERATNP